MIGRGMRRTRRPRLGLIERSLIEGSLINRNLIERSLATICRDLALQVRSAISKKVRNEPCVNQGRPYILEVTSGRPGFSYLSVSHFDLAKATQNRDQAVRESCRRTMGSLLKAVPPLMGNSDVLRDQVGVMDEMGGRCGKLRSQA